MIHIIPCPFLASVPFFKGKAIRDSLQVLFYVDPLYFSIRSLPPTDKGIFPTEFYCFGENVQTLFGFKPIHSLPCTNIHCSAKCAFQKHSLCSNVSLYPFVWSLQIMIAATEIKGSFYFQRNRRILWRFAHVEELFCIFCTFATLRLRQ